MLTWLMSLLWCFPTFILFLVFFGVFSCTLLCVCVRFRACGGGWGVYSGLSRLSILLLQPLLVVWVFLLSGWHAEDFNLQWQYLSESYPSLPVYFGIRWGSRGIAVFSSRGFFARVILPSFCNLCTVVLHCMNYTTNIRFNQNTFFFFRYVDVKFAICVNSNLSNSLRSVNYCYVPRLCCKNPREI